MSDLREQLNRVSERMNVLESQPSSLTRDALLADLRTLYDAVLSFKINTAVTEPLKEKLVAQVKKAPAPVPVDEPVAEKQPEPTPKVIVEKKTEAKEPRVAEKEATPSDENLLAGKLNKKPLADLSSIPLNEKFGIIQGLFKGNASDFGDVILKLNNSGSAKEMEHYLNLLKQRFNWDESSEAYISFSGYVARRMMAVVAPSNSNTDQ